MWKSPDTDDIERRIGSPENWHDYSPEQLRALVLDTLSLIAEIRRLEAILDEMKESERLRSKL